MTAAAQQRIDDLTAVLRDLVEACVTHSYPRQSPSYRLAVATLKGIAPTDEKLAAFPALYGALRAAVPHLEQLAAAGEPGSPVYGVLQDAHAALARIERRQCP